MFMHLTRELARAERLKSEVSLLVMDLDNFKDINDTYGHHVGDRALREVAGVLRTGIRPYDICVRYAGDEFIVVLSGCGGEEAERKRLELQRAVDSAAVRSAAGQDAAAGDQRRRGGLPARRRHLRDAARDRRQPHVPRQDAAQAGDRRRRRGDTPTSAPKQRPFTTSSCSGPRRNPVASYGQLTVLARQSLSHSSHQLRT